MQNVTDAVLRAPPGLSGAPLAVALTFAEWAILAGPLVLAWLWMVGSRADRSAAIAAAVAGLVGLCVAAACSPIIDEARPFVHGAVVNHLHHAPDGGFPSDHATLAFSLALRRPPLAPHAWFPLAVLAVAIGWARVVLGAHYPIDIVGGAVVGSAAVLSTASRIGKRLLCRLDRLDAALRSGMSAACGRLRRGR